MKGFKSLCFKLGRFPCVRLNISHRATYMKRYVGYYQSQDASVSQATNLQSFQLRYFLWVNNLILLFCHNDPFPHPTPCFFYLLYAYIHIFNPSAPSIYPTTHPSAPIIHSVPHSSTLIISSTPCLIRLLLSSHLPPCLIRLLLSSHPLHVSSIYSYHLIHPMSHPFTHIISSTPCLTCLLLSSHPPHVSPVYSYHLIHSMPLSSLLSSHPSSMSYPFTPIIHPPMSHLASSIPGSLRADVGIFTCLTWTDNLWLVLGYTVALLRR